MRHMRNIALTFHDHSNASLTGECLGTRYHLWLDPATLVPVDDTVYKTPPLPAGVPEYRAKVIRLTRTRGAGAQVAAVLLAAVPDLEPAARGAKAERERMAAQRAAEERATECARDAGPQLLAAASKVLDACGTGPDDLRSALDELQKAVEAATPKE